MKVTTKDIAFTAIIAALYVVLTLLLYPISFLGIQFRFSELLIILCFFNRKYSFGLVLGCALANLASPLGFYDALFGTSATFLVVLALCFIPYLAIDLFLAAVINGLVVGAELYFILGEAFWLSCGLVALGEFAVLTVGYIAMFFLRKRPGFMNAIQANRNLDYKF